MDVLMEVVNRTSSWPKSSTIRFTQAPFIAEMVGRRREEIEEIEDLLRRQWAWCDKNEGRVEPEQFAQKESLLLATLADYEDLLDGLHIAEAFLADVEAEQVAA